jgi:hypothetical protein
VNNSIEQEYVMSGSKRVICKVEDLDERLSAYSEIELASWKPFDVSDKEIWT